MAKTTSAAGGAPQSQEEEAEGNTEAKKPASSRSTAKKASTGRGGATVKKRVPARAAAPSKRKGSGQVPADGPTGATRGTDTEPSDARTKEHADHPEVKHPEPEPDHPEVKHPEVKHPEPDHPEPAAPAGQSHTGTSGTRPSSMVDEEPAVADSHSQGIDDEEFLAEIRLLLEEERASNLAQAADLKAEAESLTEEMEPGDVQFDEESGEGATIAVDRERDLTLSAQALAAVEEIDAALAKLDDGTYGICENCHTLIPRARLKALPYARLCVACKSGGLSRR